ncbi:MAG: hypothetical protein RQ731_08560 [Anaerosomatales bacterium]|nr:hypothetical protein [Anaerosomatales bacterium]MDT8434790.1 hypothetical protein [Anaerosomatales bacterium]
MHRYVEGPARYFVEHPLGYVLSLAGAGAALRSGVSLARCHIRHPHG